MDSTNTGNSQYSSTSSISSNKIAQKNSYVHAGILFGAAIPILVIKPKQKLILQAHLVPEINIRQSILWHQNTSTRYFTTKKINRNFNVTQALSLLWSTNAKETFLIGPYYNFKYFSLNKKVNTISNIYNQNIGVQFQIKF